MGFLCREDGCEREFDTEQGMNLHHTQVHKDSSKVTVECDAPGCDGTKEEYKSEVERSGELNFCDGECQGKYTTMRQSGSGNPRWDEDKELQLHNCEYCNSEYENYKSESETRFCSRDCYARWMSENRVGEECPAWQEENRPDGHRKGYGKNWEETRQDIIEQAGYECEECGVSNEEHKMNKGHGLHVHHIEPLRTFDSIEEANKENNLEALCAGCHRENEWKAL
jgi:hypothetical protein